MNKLFFVMNIAIICTVAYIAIYAGEKNEKGEPIIISTGGSKDKKISKLSIFEYAQKTKATILGWAKLHEPSL